MTSTLTTLAPLVGIIAAERTHERPDLYDDAVQEGLIAAWQAQEARPESTVTYLTGAARNGVRGAVGGRAPFGHSPHRGTQDAADTAIPTDSSVFPDPIDPTATYAIEAAEDRLHSTEIRAAVNTLTELDRVIVRLRFVEGLPWAHIATRLGLQRLAPQRRFNAHIRPTLARALPHLEELIA